MAPDLIWNRGQLNGEITAVFQSKRRQGQLHRPGPNAINDGGLAYREDHQHGFWSEFQHFLVPHFARGESHPGGSFQGTTGGKLWRRLSALGATGGDAIAGLVGNFRRRNLAQYRRFSTTGAFRRLGESTGVPRPEESAREYRA